jgi:hypothetical protein
MKTYVGVEVDFHGFLNLALDGNFPVIEIQQLTSPYWIWVVVKFMMMMMMMKQ